MRKKQLAALFICSFIPWTIGNALFALLPLYAARLGVNPGLIGDYLASAFFALAIGTIAAGWLSDRFKRRKAFIIGAGLVNFPATWLMGQTTQLWQLVVLTAIVWFCVGVVISMTAILAGMFAQEAERGKVFGILGLNLGLGAMIGGAISGGVVDRWGFPALFTLAAPCWLLQPLIALLLQDNVSAATQTAVAPMTPKRSLGSAFYLLVLATILAGVAGFISSLGRPLQMDKLGFDTAGISGVIAIGGAVSLPFPLLVGWLSDRMGRDRLLVLCFAAVAVGMAVLVGSTLLWQFWLSGILLAIGGANSAVGSALVADLVPAEALGVGLAQYGATNWIGGVIGLAGTGYAIQLFGMAPTFSLGVVLCVIAIIFLVGVRRARSLALVQSGAIFDTGPSPI